MRVQGRHVAFAIWLAWTAWVVGHYFTIARDPVVAFNGPVPVGALAADALVRTLRALAAAALVACAAWGVGRAVMNGGFAPLFADVRERILFTAALGCGVLAYALLALAYAHAYSAPAIAAVIGTAACAGVVAAVREAAAHRPARFGDRPPRSPVERAIAVCSVAAVACALAGALAPETEFDALWYHLWLPAKWLDAARPVDIVEEYVSLYPLTWEMLYGAALALGGPIAAKLLHWMCLPLLGASTYALSRRLFPDASASLAAALTVTAPVVAWEATTAYVDLPLALYITLAVYALFRHDATRKRRWLVLAALMLGFALGIKHLALVALAIVAPILLLREWRRTTAAMAVRTTATFAVLALLVPVPWYGRSFAASGNPVFPEMYSLFGARPEQRWTEQTERGLQAFKAHFGRTRTASNLLALPWDITVHGAAYGGTLGPLFLILVPAAILGYRREGGAAGVLGIGCALYIAFWASPFSSFQLRFLIPIVPPLAVLSALGAARLTVGARASSIRAPLAAGIVVVLLVLNLPPTIEWHERDRQGWSGWLTHVTRGVPLAVLLGVESERAYLARTVPSYRAWQFIDGELAVNARVLTFSAGDQLYSHRRRIWSDATAARDMTWGTPAGDEPAAIRAAARHGVTHVLVDKKQLADGSLGTIAIGSDRMRDCCLSRVYEDDRFALYVVDPQQALSALAGVREGDTAR